MTTAVVLFSISLVINISYNIIITETLSDKEYYENMSSEELPDLYFQFKTGYDNINKKVHFAQKNKLGIYYIIDKPIEKCKNYGTLLSEAKKKDKEIEIQKEIKIE